MPGIHKEIADRSSWLALTLLAGFSSVAIGAVAQDRPDQAFAIVNGKNIPIQVYRQTARNLARNKFYHGKAPDDELQKFHYEVGQQLIDSFLMLQEADRRHIDADQEWVSERLERFKKRFESHPKWKTEGKLALNDMRTRLRQRSILRQLERQIQDLPQPAQADVAAYYREHADKFTSPARTRARFILLKVEPWADSEVWQDAFERMGAIAAQLGQGKSFSELARKYSQDPSAERGGDLGYLHSGMLGETARKVVDEIEPGQVSQPVQLLEGIALFKVEDRQAPVLNPLAKVRERASNLLYRDMQARALDEFKRTLRRSAAIEIIDKQYLALRDRFAGGETAPTSTGKP